MWSWMCYYRSLSTRWILKRLLVVPLTVTQMCQRAAKDRAAIDFIQSDTCETFNSALKMVENFYRSLGDNKKPKIIYYPMHKGGNHWMLYVIINLHRALNNQGGFCGFFCLNSMGPNLYGLEPSQEPEGLQMFINIFLNYSKRFGNTGSMLKANRCYTMCIPIIT